MDHRSVGSPRGRLGRRALGRIGAGQATLLRGSATGLTATGAVAYSQDTAGVPGTAEQGDRFAAAVHLIDVTKDGRTELAVGAPGENADGLLWTAKGATAGPVTSGSKTLSGTAAGLKRKYAEVEFGAALPGARKTG
ncbi:FG-GAP repeat protein [Streptomyces sp. NPDC091290]|uniref:FG-GAP repeat protein n=1 Tax=Streptomyces sp. NPDC091290 TaxID=3365990 RepID=UPI0038277A80